MHSSSTDLIIYSRVFFTFRSTKSRKPYPSDSCWNKLNDLGRMSDRQGSIMDAIERLRVKCHFFKFTSFLHPFRGEQLRVLRRYMRVRSMSAQTPLCVWLGWENQPVYDVTGDLWVAIRINVINIQLVRLSPQQWPKLGRGTAKGS